MNVGRIGKGFGLVAVAAFFSMMVPETSHAESAPALANWASLGGVSVDKSGCPSCPATFTTSQRHRNFGLTSDSLFPVSLSGRVDVTCANGTTYNYLLSSSSRSGLFQVIPNLCVNFDSQKVKLTITSVGLTPPDTERTVGLGVHGSSFG